MHTIKSSGCKMPLSTNARCRSPIVYDRQIFRRPTQVLSSLLLGCNGQVQMHKHFRLPPPRHLESHSSLRLVHNSSQNTPRWLTHSLLRFSGP